MDDCHCDTKPPASGGAGFSAFSPDLRRSFAEVRRLLLARIASLGTSDPHLLAQGNPADLTNLVVEAWSYISDALSLHDRVTAGNFFVGSSLTRASLGRIVVLLGHLPRPAAASEADLALLFNGIASSATERPPIFRGSRPVPQIFEAPAPLLTSTKPSSAVLAPQRSMLTFYEETSETLSLLLEAETAAPLRGLPILFIWSDQFLRMRATEIIDATATKTADNRDYIKITVVNPLLVNPNLQAPALFAPNIDVRTVSVFSPSQRAYTRSTLFGPKGGTLGIGIDLEAENFDVISIKPGGYGSNKFDINSNIIDQVPTQVSTIDLDSVYRSISASDLVIIQKGEIYSPHRVTYTTERLPHINSKDDQPAIPITQLTVYPVLPDSFSDSDQSDQLIIHYNLHDIGLLTRPAHAELSATLLLNKDLDLEGVHDISAANGLSHKWILEDANGDGALVDAAMTVKGDGSAQLRITGGTWEKPLRVPVVAYPNVLHVTRGETVRDEVLGDGDPTRPYQSFQLKKSPLTYLRAPGGDNSLKSTLEVRVDGVLWHERRTFYGAGPNDAIYIVRHDDDEHAIITFGDGTRGARPASGQRNIRATYRFGAGAEAPPTGNLTQIVRGFPGLTRVRNPIAASGGADRESARELRKSAPASALVLGRCVSLADFGARVAGMPGMVNSKVALAWDEQSLAAVVKVWYLAAAGSGDLAPAIVNDLRAISEPGTQIQASPAKPLAWGIVLGLAVHSDYIIADVEQAVITALLDPDTGLLAPEKTPIGGALARSAVR